MKNLVYKIWYAFLRTIRLQWKSIISMFFALIGAAFTIAEILNNVFETPIGFNIMRRYTAEGLFLSFVICIILNWKSLSFSCFLENADTKITLRVCDIFAQNGALVIPTNTTFDTSIDDEFISIKSVQGQYQEKYYRNALSNLNRGLSYSLQETSYILLYDGRLTNTKRYPIGTTAKVSRGLQHDYFLAIADINKHGKPENVTFENITTALVSFWQHLNEFGHIETIRMPIIGTGRAGLKDASRDKIIQEIIFSFVLAAREMKVTENLVICIHPADFAHKNLHWDDLCDYLKYTCKYQIHEQGAPEGHPETESKGIPWGTF